MAHAGVGARLSGVFSGTVDEGEAWSGWPSYCRFVHQSDSESVPCCARRPGHLVREVPTRPQPG